MKHFLETLYHRLKGHILLSVNQDGDVQQYWIMDIYADTSFGVRLYADMPNGDQLDITFLDVTITGG